MLGRDYIESILNLAKGKADKINFIPVVWFVSNGDNDLSYHIILCDGENESYDIADDLADRLVFDKYANSYLVIRDDTYFATFNAKKILNRNI